MKNDFQGIIYTLRAEPELRELGKHRSTASLPFGGRYRLIDFALSAMVNAGVRDVGVIMERDYQSLLDHLSSGRDWGLSRRNGGLRLLPPFGLREAHSGHFSGCMEALRSVRSYIEDIPHENIVLASGDLVGNVDLTAAIRSHRDSGAEITAVCVAGEPSCPHHRFVPSGDGFSDKLVFSNGDRHDGLVSAEIYLLRKDMLLSFMDFCSDGQRLHFHRDALANYLAGGGRVHLYVHDGYLCRISTAAEYYRASMDMLEPEVMSGFFPEDRPIRTKERAEASTYYGERSRVRNCLVADGCYIEGELENCVLFRGVRIGRDVKLRNCVIFQDTVIETGAQLKCAIADKDVVVRSNCFLAGSERLPIVIPKGAQV